MQRKVNNVERIKTEMSLPGADAARAINWQKNLNSSFYELLKAQCGLE